MLSEKTTIQAFPLENHKEKVCLSSAVSISIFILLLLVTFAFLSLKGILFQFALVVTHFPCGMFWQREVFILAEW